MAKSIILDEKENLLRGLLIDVSNYIGSLENGAKSPELRFTGGWVRDKLLGMESHDIDVSIDTMTGFEFGNMMKDYLTQPEARRKYNQDLRLAKIEANPEKSKHLETITTKILGLDIDLVNLRKETYAEDSRNPMMTFGTPEEDALRRDATVNALFYNLVTGAVEDWTKRGLDDMTEQIIRTPLAPYQTFKDDPLRVLRCIRFASKLGYSIDEAAKQAMRDNSIQDALRAKISRERVGVEIEKMLRGPNPKAALELIDESGLYNTIFTGPPGCNANLANWKETYIQLQQIINPTKIYGNVDKLQTLKAILLRDRQEEYLAWLLSAFAPWASTSAPNGPAAAPRPRLHNTVAATVAQESLKLDGKTIKLIAGAVSNCDDIPLMKKDITKNSHLATSPLKRKNPFSSREELGMKIRHWGCFWRSQVIFALLVEIMNAAEDCSRQAVICDYAAFLSKVQELELLDAWDLKPLVRGNELVDALKAKTGLKVKNGAWVKDALEIAMRWQLRNPEQLDPKGAIEEVVEKRDEIRFT